MQALTFKSTMKHVIDKSVEIEEFKKQFQDIKNEFILSLKEHCRRNKVTKFLSCDEDGKKVAWVWNDETFQNDIFEGEISDAIAFAGHMIDQGMCFSYMGASCRNEEVEVWLSAFEYPIENPIWPEGRTIVFERTHGGITRG
jgi:hypothetical protein